MVSFAPVASTKHVMESLRPLKGILKKRVQSSFAPIEFRGGLQNHHAENHHAFDDYLYYMHIASVWDWYSRYPPVDGSKKDRVTFNDHRTVNVFLVDGPMEEFSGYPHHDPDHIRVSEHEYSAEDLKMLGGEEGCPEQLFEHSETSSDTSSEGGPATPPLSPISTFDVVDIQFVSRSWDDIMDEDAEIELGRPMVAKPMSTTTPNIATFDGLGVGIKGRRWDEDDEDDLPNLPMTATPPNVDIFDGRGLNIKGTRWDEDDEDETPLVVPSTIISDDTAPHIAIFDGLGTGIKGRRWDDDDEEDDLVDIPFYTTVAAMATQSQQNVDACDGLGTRLKGPAGIGLDDGKAVSKEKLDQSRPRIDKIGGLGRLATCEG
ncbi:hypothetical protein VFPBJ_11076 [Purpureocillium lilacinum]|uniref:Uncharacterized protein n=1 Tax=Purpureocillium lilacinum TaxID=33203 RepID=A0A179FQQ4_PURLI|nr:hypothetical protein VFPBJ_11076 [Purpureocillium lilacinum]